MGDASGDPGGDDGDEVVADAARGGGGDAVVVARGGAEGGVEGEGEGHVAGPVWGEQDVGVGDEVEVGEVGGGGGQEVVILLAASGGEARDAAGRMGPVVGEAAKQGEGGVIFRFEAEDDAEAARVGLRERCADVLLKARVADALGWD